MQLRKIRRFTKILRPLRLIRRMRRWLDERKRPQRARANVGVGFQQRCGDQPTPITQRAARVHHRENQGTNAEHQQARARQPQPAGAVSRHVS